MHLYIIRARADRFSSVMRCFVGVFLYRAAVYTDRRGGAGAPRWAVVYIVKNANGTFSLWRPFCVDIFIARPGCAWKKNKKQKNKTKKRIGARLKYTINGKRQTFISLLLIPRHRRWPVLRIRGDFRRRASSPQKGNAKLLSKRKLRGAC